MSWLSWKAAVVGSIACLMVIDGAVAQSGSPVAKGEQIARRLCASCHSIATTGKSPHELAPPFRELSARYPISHLAEALAEGIVVPHKDMPRFVLEPREIDALLTFIEALAPDARRR